MQNRTEVASNMWSNLFQSKNAMMSIFCKRQSVDWLTVSYPTRYKIGHFADVLPNQSLGSVLKKLKLTQTRMWANAQRDGRPAEYRWRPMFNAAVWLCSNAAKTRDPLKFGCPKLTKRSQPLVGRRSPYCDDMWGRYCCLTSFFPIVDACLNCEDIARQSCAMVRRWRFFTSFLHSVFPAGACSTFQTCILNKHPICGHWD